MDTVRTATSCSSGARIINHSMNRHERRVRHDLISERGIVMMVERLFLYNGLREPVAFAYDNVAVVAKLSGSDDSERVFCSCVEFKALQKFKLDSAFRSF
jgi:hypothetical protein